MKPMTPQVSCRYCKKEFKSLSNANRHSQYHCSKNPDRKPLRCAFCQKEISSLDAMKKHISSKHKVQKLKTCDQCGKKFKEKHSCGHACPYEGCNERFPPTQLLAMGHHLVAHFESVNQEDHIKKEFEEAREAEANSPTDDQSDNEEVLQLEPSRYNILRVFHIGTKRPHYIRNVEKLMKKVWKKGPDPINNDHRIYIFKTDEQCANAGVGKYD